MRSCIASLIALIFSTVLSQAQLDQKYLNYLIQNYSLEEEIIKKEYFKNGIVKISSEILYNCYGDICMEIRYGLWNKNDSLSVVFNEIIDLKNGLFYLRKGDSTAIIDSSFLVKSSKQNPILRNGGFFIFKSDSSWGMLDSSLTIRIEPSYDSIGEVFDWSDFSDTDVFNAYNYFFKARKGEFWSVVDLNDSAIFDFIYDEIYPQFEGAIVKKNNKMGFIDQYNRIRVPIAFDSVIHGFSNAIVLKEGKMALYSIGSDTLITDFIYTDFTEQSPYFCRCMKGPEGWEMLTARGERIGDSYESIKNYGTDVMPVSNKGKWGFVDCKSQKVLTELKYDRVLRFFGHEAIVLYQGEDMKISFD